VERLWWSSGLFSSTSIGSHGNPVIIELAVPQYVHSLDQNWGYLMGSVLF